MSGPPGTPFDPDRPGDPTHGPPPGTRPDPGTPGTDPGMPGKDPGGERPKDPPNVPDPPRVPKLPTPEEIRDCLCRCIPIPCEAMLGAAKALLLIGIALGYVTLMLAPPDWWARALFQAAVQGSSDAARLARVTGAAGVGGASGGAPVAGAVGAGAGGAVGSAASPVGTVVGAAGGGAAAGAAGGAAAGSGAAGTALGAELADLGFWRTLEVVVRVTDALIVWLGMAILLLSQIVLLLAVFLFVVWFVCCTKGDWCRLIGNLCWVLEAALIVVLPLIGTILGFGLGLFMVFEVPAASRAGLPFLMSLFGGLLLGTIIYGVLRWLRDTRRCPVLVLWQWPWTEERVP